MHQPRPSKESLHKKLIKYQYVEEENGCNLLNIMQKSTSKAMSAIVLYIACIPILHYHGCISKCGHTFDQEVVCKHNEEG